MAIEAFIRGDTANLPILVCLPGMFGVPENFEEMMLSWQHRFASVLVDLHPQNRKSGLADSQASLSTVSYDKTSEEIHDWLVQNLPNRKFYFLGVSIGGKLIFDFAAKYPDLYLGGIVTDVGLGTFENSDLYQFVEEVIPSLNLEQEWAGIKAELRAKVKVNPVRVLMQTQIDYSETEKRGKWKKAVQGLKNFLGAQRIADQWGLRPLLQKGTTILKAEFLSGISDSDYTKMKAIPELFCFEIVTGSAHLLHVTHPEWIQRAVLNLPLETISVKTNSVQIRGH